MKRYLFVLALVIVAVFLLKDKVSKNSQTLLTKLGQDEQVVDDSAGGQRVQNKLFLVNNKSKTRSAYNDDEKLTEDSIHEEVLFTDNALNELKRCFGVRINEDLKSLGDFFDNISISKQLFKEKVGSNITLGYSDQFGQEYKLSGVQNAGSEEVVYLKLETTKTIDFSVSCNQNLQQVDCDCLIFK